MDNSLSPLPAASPPLSQSGEANGGSGKASSAAAYREFVRRAGAELLAVPDNPMSLLSGSAFRALRPELYEKVRQGRAEFGMPTEQVYDNLTAWCAMRRCALCRRLRSWFVRSAKYVILYLRVAWLVRIVFPLTARKMRSPPGRRRAGKCSFAMRKRRRQSSAADFHRGLRAAIGFPICKPRLPPSWQRWAGRGMN